MRSKGNAPTAAQKRFRENLRELYPGSVIHHPVGVTGKHNKVKIGHWWIIALSEASHDLIHTIGKERKDEEKLQFFVQMLMYMQVYGKIPVPAEVINSISDYHL